MKMDWIKKMTVAFWVIMGVVLLAVVYAFYYMSVYNPNHDVMVIKDQSDRIVGESIAILTMLLGIPLSLRLYHVYTKNKLPKEKDEEQKVAHIVKWFLLRIGVVLVALALNFIAWMVFGSQSAFLCVVICLLFLLFFCKPNRNDLTYMLENHQEEKSCE
ncbi:MAG: hypothetical protein J6T67_09030 [Paludibacteraceae bacterium]|nr:hypothetical protein [Paludibacteraceae bacterium]MBR4712970.1 hypothetical protein [Paludibacteraceae bacterium]MBR5375597.1 hypothetical protein [Paludibacteraceae bacterium]